MQQKENALPFDVAAALRRGKLLLEDRQWDRAASLYDQILTASPENAEAYVGNMLAAAKCSNLKEMAQTLPTLFSEESPEFNEACRPDETRVEALSRQYAVEGVITPEEIAAEAAFDLRYPSRVPAARENRRRLEERLQGDVNYRRALQFGDDALRSELARLEASALTACDYRISAAERDAEKARQEVISQYEAHLARCEQAAEKRQEEAFAKLENDQKKLKTVRKGLKVSLLISLAAVMIFGGIVLSSIISSTRNNTLETESPEKIAYLAAEKLLDDGQTAKAAIAFGKLGDYLDARDRSFALWDKVAKRDTIAAGTAHTVALKRDGTLVAKGNNNRGECNVKNFNDIISIAVGRDHTVGLHSNGTTIATTFLGKDNQFDHYMGQCEVSDWEDIVAITAGDCLTVGIKKDGTVVAVGQDSTGKYNISSWTDIIAVAIGQNHVLGLKADGTIVSTGSVAIPSGQTIIRFDGSGWSDISSVAAGYDYSVGLRNDGTVIAEGKNDDGQCNVSNWSGIVAISVGDDHTVGLREDGTVVATGNNDDNQCNVSDWTHIVAIAAGFHYTIGLKSNGKVVAAGINNVGECDVYDWFDIKVP